MDKLNVILNNPRNKKENAEADPKNDKLGSVATVLTLISMQVGGEIVNVPNNFL